MADGEPAFRDHENDTMWFAEKHSPKSAGVMTWAPIGIIDDQEITLLKPTDIRGWELNITGDVSPVALREALDLAELIMKEHEEQ